MNIDDQFRRIQGPDPRVASVKLQTDGSNVNGRKNLRLTGEPKGSGAQPARASKTSSIDSSSANDFQGNQQRNMELKSSFMYLMPMGGGSPVPLGPLNAAKGGNAFDIVLSGNHSLQFNWDGFDGMSGLRRGNIRTDRLMYMTVFIKHNGHTLTLPNGIKWNDGEAPDLTPKNANTEHIIHFMCKRVFNGTGYTNTIYGIPASINAE